MLSPSKKRLRVNLEGPEESKLANSSKGEGFMMGKVRLEKFSWWNGQHKPKRRRKFSTNLTLADQLKGSKLGFLLPSTCMAAHAVDVVETIKMVEKFELVGAASTGVEKGAAYEIPGFPFPLLPPLPVPQNAYSEFKGGDENTWHHWNALDVRIDNVVAMLSPSFFNLRRHSIPLPPNYLKNHKEIIYRFHGLNCGQSLD
ncbi:hypothetical protein F0562_011003 [Nyssa sinensis]|uniref:Uncharacterized protein n=1 Tax=Nyssa sinensis TaxID=561372 RepID=A0A5J5A2A2_9ASTE|nr:hypothetical protein F0562_011003 [Nyssa sinensis]